MDFTEIQQKVRKYPLCSALSYDEVDRQHIQAGHCYVILTIGDNDHINFGHYVVLDIRPAGSTGHVEKIKYFDSFGDLPDEVRQDYVKMHQAGQGDNHRIQEVIDSFGLPVTYNRHDYQKEGTDSCGDWALLFCRYPKTDREPWTSLKGMNLTAGEKEIQRVAQFL